MGDESLEEGGEDVLIVRDAKLLIDYKEGVVRLEIQVSDNGVYAWAYGEGEASNCLRRSRREGEGAVREDVARGKKAVREKELGPGGSPSWADRGLPGGAR